MSDTGRVIALDLGAKRIGVAVCDPAGVLASPYSTIDRSGDSELDHRAVFEVVEELEAVRVVVGLPLKMSGERGSAAVAAESEAEQLRRALPVPVELVDERLTTVTAARALHSAGVNSRAQRKGGRIDQEAATVLLQAWLDRNRTMASTRPGVGVGPHAPEEGGAPGSPPGGAI